MIPFLATRLPLQLKVSTQLTLWRQPAYPASNVTASCGKSTVSTTESVAVTPGSCHGKASSCCFVGCGPRFGRIGGT